MKPTQRQTTFRVMNATFPEGWARATGTAAVGTQRGGGVSGAEMGL